MLYSQRYSSDLVPTSRGVTLRSQFYVTLHKDKSHCFGPTQWMG
jgi:hypothetical protein